MSEEDLYFEDNEFPFEEDEFEDEFPVDAQERVAMMEEDLSEIQFDTDEERNAFYKKYSKALEEAGYNEDVIDEKIEDLKNSTMTREDYCDYYNCDDSELDDVMDDDCKDW